MAKVARTKVADTADWLGRGLIDHVHDLSCKIKPELASLQRRFDRRLRTEGFDAVQRQALAKVSPLAAAQTLLSRKALARFFEDAEVAGRELARLNVNPTKVIRALQLCDSVINEAQIDFSPEWAREQLTFCTILSLNHAYYEVREAESRAFHELYQIEVQASNVDVLYRLFVEAMARNCGAAAGHVFLLDEPRQHWHLKASTAQAASRKTLAILPASASVRRALLKLTRLRDPKLILDAGWQGRYRSVWSVPLETGVVQFAFAQDRELLPRDIEMLVAAGNRCQAAAQKTKLLEEIALREDQLSKLAIRMLMVEENERRRISRELHDDAGQSLVVIRLQMEMIEQSLREGSEERERLAEARDITEKTILDIRRLISDLSPAVLEQLGLGAALRQLANRFRERYPSQVQLHVDQLPQMDTNFQLVIYRLAQECFNNIAEHSEATTVNISITAVDRVLRLQVEDNGKGFHVEEALDRRNYFGLLGIRERVAVLGGSVSITSTRKQGNSRGAGKKSGTVIKIELPLP